MPNPSYVTQQNVRFDGTLDNAVVLSTSGGVRKLILWDDLSLADQQIIIDFVAANGGTAPAVGGPSAGKAEINYGSATGATATGLNNGTAATAGYQNILFSSTTGASATGLANDATTYTATITIDSVAIPVSVVGSAAQTFTTLIAEIQTDIGAAGTITNFGPGVLRVTSASTGTSSTVAIVDGTLFAAVTGFQSIPAAVAGVAAVPATTYTATVTIDGVAKPISILGSAAQTFTTLVSELSTDIGAAGTVSLTGGKIVITSATTGVTSTVAVTNGTLFGAVAGYVGVVITPGAAAIDLWNLFQTTRSPNGALFTDVIKVLQVGAKPTVLPNIPHTIQFTYYDGSEWLYLDDDTPVCA